MNNNNINAILNRLFNGEADFDAVDVPTLIDKALAPGATSLVDKMRLMDLIGRRYPDGVGSPIV